jgi:hypothetical protein
LVVHLLVSAWTIFASGGGRDGVTLR